jgi:hypothetical protein
MLRNGSWIMHRGRTWDWDTRPSQRADRGLADTRSRPATLDDVVVAVCFLALVGLVVFGGLLMLFFWVTAGLPPSALTTCSVMDSCVAPAPTEHPAAWVEVPRVDEPTATP